MAFYSIFFRSKISIESKWKSFQDHESADSGKAFLADFQNPKFKRDEKMSWSDHDLVNIRQFEESLSISHVSCLDIFTFFPSRRVCRRVSRRKALRIGNFSHYSRYRIILTINQQKESLKWKQIRLRKHNKLLIHDSRERQEEGITTFNYCADCVWLSPENGNRRRKITTSRAGSVKIGSRRSLKGTLCRVQFVAKIFSANSQRLSSWFLSESQFHERTSTLASAKICFITLSLVCRNGREIFATR